MTPDALLIAAATSMTLVLMPRLSSAQLMPRCAEDSPERRGGLGCSILHARVLPRGLETRPVFWHIDRFDSLEPARAAAGDAAVAVEAADSVWLLTIESQTADHHGGRHVAQLGPLALPPAPRYSLQILSAAFAPGMYTVVHHHTGVEAIFVIEGEACYETPDRAARLQPGETLSIPTGVPHRAVATGTVVRKVIGAIVHDSSRPPTVRMDEAAAPVLASCQSPTEPQ